MVELPVAQTGFMLLHLRRVPELALLADRKIHTETKRRTRDKTENTKFKLHRRRSPPRNIPMRPHRKPLRNPKAHRCTACEEEAPVFVGGIKGICRGYHRALEQTPDACPLPLCRVLLGLET